MLLIMATIAWVGLGTLAAPLLVHPYLIHGLEHAAHFYSALWTTSFVVMVGVVLAAVPLIVWWQRHLRR